MSASTYNLTIEQGATFDLGVTWEDAEGNPVDLTGYTVRAQMRYSYGTSTAALAFTVTITDADAGEISVAATATQTAALTQDGVWDLEVESPTGRVDRLLSGTVELSKEATRA